MGRAPGRRVVPSGFRLASQPAKVLAQAPKTGIAGGELPRLVGDEEVELVGERGEVRGRGEEQAHEGPVVAGALAVVSVLVLAVGERGEGGFGAVEASERPSPPRLLARRSGSRRRESGGRGSKG